ncbi:type IX secretion system PorP/SprF family membrane protein [Tenacibaculum adriaticum]|uniref:Type IX secretion system PorP/SprF family membrane protein n=1 Tax=Tenacibaculum adriaticum TaxID=413713 RepID=A0A5S5DMB6_9FLAO|nr:PorP/SprF family type IX secretion system membrane protein [Tenacibaculum adriaticum]TYP97073.1 type IX secretion system PorP/SprF family membrane protein [Tenacibaculum adriaticum]
MIKKITLNILILLAVSTSFAQGGGLPEDEYSGFSSRSFMKFNNFLSVPTFSLLHGNTRTIQAITRNANIQFEDASRLQILSYSGKVRENVGAGMAVFQQEIGAFKDFGALANYAYQVQLGAESKLTFGFNFFYSRRGLDNPRVLSNGDESLINNYQDKPVVVFQPAATVSFGKFYAGLFFENLGDFNLKRSEFVTSFADKTISAHAGYTTDFNNFSGLLEDANLRFLGVVRRSKIDGFSYSGNVLADLPKAGWVKVGYDNLFGLNAGLGINLSENLSIGFSYEKQDNLGGTNEVGLIYSLGKTRTRRDRISKPNVEIILPDDTTPEVKPVPVEIRKEEYKDEEHNDLSDEIQRAQDSLNTLHKKVDEILNLLKNQPKQVEIIREVKTVVQPKEVLDTSLKRSKETPWRKKTITRTSSGGGGGTMYYVAVDLFKDDDKAKDLVALYKKRKIKVKYVRDPRTKMYYVYVDRFAKKEDAEEKVDEVNGTGTKRFEDDKKDDKDKQAIKAEKTYKDPVYVVKITLGGEGETYTEPKRQPKARVSNMKMMNGLEEGYYLVVNVFSKKPYADKFIDELRTDGIDAGYFLNPETGYRHVYIHKTDKKEEAIRLYNNNLNNSYYDRKNIVHIR